MELQARDYSNLRTFRSFRPGQRPPLAKFFDGVMHLYFEGTPGCGKTIVVAIVCSVIVNRWHGSLFQEGERPPRIVILVPDNEIKMQTIRTLYHFLANAAVLADNQELGELPCAWCKVEGRWEEASSKYLDSCAEDQEGVSQVFRYFSVAKPSADCPEEDCWDIEEFLALPEAFRDAFKARGVLKPVHEEVKHARPLLASTKDIEALSAWPLVVVCTYQQITSSNRAEESLAARLGPLDMLAVDEAHRIINHTCGQDWKGAVAKLCQQAERVYAFSGSPLEGAEFERMNFERVVWSVEDALGSGDIVPFEPLPVDAHFFDSLLSEDARFFREALAALDHRKGTPQKLHLDMRRDLNTVLALVGFMLWHNRYFRLTSADGASPWVNTLLLTDRNHHGTDLKTLITLVVGPAGAGLLKKCLERIAGMPPFNLEGADCAELLQDARCLQIFHPYVSKRDRPVCLETLRRVPQFPPGGGALLGPLEPMPLHVLICSKWAAEGTDIPALHAVVHARSGMSKVGMIQSNARANRPSPFKRHGYLLACNRPDHHANLDFLEDMDVEAGDDCEDSESEDEASSVPGPPPAKKRKQSAQDGPRRIAKHEESIDAVEAIMQSALVYSRENRDFCVYAMPDRYEEMKSSMAALRYAHLRRIRGNCHRRWPELEDFGELGLEKVVVVCLYELDLHPNGVMICLCLLSPCKDAQRVSRTTSNWTMKYLSVRHEKTGPPVPWTRFEICELLASHGGVEARLTWDGTSRSLKSEQDDKFLAVREPYKEGVEKPERKPPLAAVPEVAALVLKKAPAENRGIVISRYEGFGDAFLIGNEVLGMQTDLHGGCSDGNMAFTTSGEKWNSPFFLLAFHGDSVQMDTTDNANSMRCSTDVDGQLKLKRNSTWRCKRDCDEGQRSVLPEEEFVLCASVERFPRALVVVAPLGGKRCVHYRLTKASGVAALLETKVDEEEKALLWQAEVQGDRRFRLYAPQLQKYLYWRQRNHNSKRAEAYRLEDSSEAATLFEARPVNAAGGFKMYANEEHRPHQNISCDLQGQLRRREGRGKVPTVTQDNGRDDTIWHALPVSGFHGASGRGLDDFSNEAPTFGEPEPRSPAGGYDASKFSEAHDLWKDDVIRQGLRREREELASRLSDNRRRGVLEAAAGVLAERDGCTVEQALEELAAMEEAALLQKVLECRCWVFFDDYDKQGKVLRVASALLKSGRPAASLYCANPKKKIFQDLKRLKVNASRRRIEEALPGRAWAKASFSVAYLDSCYGSWEKLFVIMEMLHKRRMLDEGAFVVVTLTLRGGDGQPPAERFSELAEKVSVLGFQQVAVEEQHKNIYVRFFRFTAA